jgi:putative ABC transport system substrate-binding protein
MSLLLVSLVSAQDIKRVILLETMPVPAVLEHSKWFQTQLREMGYEEGKNLNLTILKAEGDRELAEKLLSAELAKGNPDLVVTIATLASQTAAKLLNDTDIPILFFQVSDPVGAGLVKQINAPTGTNITGKVYTVSRDAKIEMILRLVGQTVAHRPVRFGFIHSTYPSALGDIRELKHIEKARDDIVFIPYEIQYKEVPAGLPAMLEETKRTVKTLEDKIDFWIEPMGPLGETAEYTRILLENSAIPIVLGTKLDSVKMGALMHVTPNMEASGRETALLADQILKGKDPGQIPVTPPSDFDLGINLTTALRLNIVVPLDILQLAGEHVYR